MKPQQEVCFSREALSHLPYGNYRLSVTVTKEGSASDWEIVALRVPPKEDRWVIDERALAVVLVVGMLLGVILGRMTRSRPLHEELSDDLEEEEGETA